jgi:hypothetical protein
MALNLAEARQMYAAAHAHNVMMALIADGAIAKSAGLSSTVQVH